MRAQGDNVSLMHRCTSSTHAHVNTCRHHKIAQRSAISANTAAMKQLWASCPQFRSHKLPKKKMRKYIYTCLCAKAKHFVRSDSSRRHHDSKRSDNRGDHSLLRAGPVWTKSSRLWVSRSSNLTAHQSRSKYYFRIGQVCRLVMICVFGVGSHIGKACCTRYSKRPIPFAHIRGFREQTAMENCHIEAIM